MWNSELRKLVTDTYGNSNSCSFLTTGEKMRERQTDRERDEDSPSGQNPAGSIWTEPSRVHLDRTTTNCYRPISIATCLSKVLEKRVHNQLTGFLDVCSILSGFRSGYECVTATLKRSSMMSPFPLILSNVVLLFLLTWPKLLIR